MNATATAQAHPFTLTDYLNGEDHSDIRHEYIDGETFALSPPSPRPDKEPAA